MKFTVPAAKDDDQAEAVWHSVRDFLLEQGLHTEETRFQRVKFTHNSRKYDLGVGDIHPDLQEPVVVILRSSDRPLYFVCTTTRGVAGGDPYLVGDGQETFATAFDPD